MEIYCFDRGGDLKWPPLKGEFTQDALPLPQSHLMPGRMKVMNNDDDAAGISLLCQDQFLSRCPLFALDPSGFCFLLRQPQNSGMPNFHLLVPTSLDITPKRKEMDSGSL